MRAPKGLPTRLRDPPFSINTELLSPIKATKTITPLIQNTKCTIIIIKYTYFTLNSYKSFIRPKNGKRKQVLIFIMLFNFSLFGYEAFASETAMEVKY